MRYSRPVPVVGSITTQPTGLECKVHCANETRPRQGPHGGPCEAHDATSCGIKSVRDAMKQRIFDAALRAKGIGREGYEKPNKAQTAKIRNIAARENKVNLDTFARSDNVSREDLLTLPDCRLAVSEAHQ